MESGKINPKTIGVTAPGGKYLTDKNKSYPASIWGERKFKELVARGFLIPDVPKNTPKKGKKDDEAVQE